MAQSEEWRDKLNQECCEEEEQNEIEREHKMPKSNVVVQLIGEDGNAFAIIGAVSKALKRAGETELAAEFTKAAFASPSYDALLQLCMEYVEVE